MFGTKSSYRLYLSVDLTGVLSAVVEAGSAGTVQIEPDKWYHLAFVRDAVGDDVRLYVDGAQWGTTLATLGVWAGPITAAWIASKDAAPFELWHGWLAHFVILPLLTPAQILDLATV